MPTMKENTVAAFDITGNDKKDVELCLTSGVFITDSPSVIEGYTKKRYDQILSEMDDHPLVKVKGNTLSLGETIWLLQNMDEVCSISITSPTERLKELDLELKISLWDVKGYMGGTDFIKINNYVKSSNPSEAYIDLTEEPLDASLPRLFISLNVKARSFFRISFAGNLKESLSPPLLQKFESFPLVCKTCGAPLHGRKCNYCGTEY